ncbi:MAG: NUDIX hydrolase [Candidatus Paceibacterota bacterium]
MANSVFSISKEMHSGEILIVKTEYGEKKWSLPGGKIEMAELKKHALIREVREETGVKLHSFQNIGQFIQRKSQGIVFLYEGVFSGKTLDIPVMDNGDIEISENKLIRLNYANWNWICENMYRAQAVLLAFYWIYSSRVETRRSIMDEYLSPPYDHINPFELLKIKSPYEKRKLKKA